MVSLMVSLLFLGRGTLRMLVKRFSTLSFVGSWNSSHPQITGRFDKDLIDALPSSVRFICHTGAGYDSVDADACATRGVFITFPFGAP